MDNVQQFRELVEVAFKASGLSPTTFSHTVSKDPNLIRELRKGREPRSKTRAQIEKKIHALVSGEIRPVPACSRKRKRKSKRAA